MRVALLVAAVAAYTAFALSVVFVFRKHHASDPLGLRILKVCAIAAAIAEVWAIAAAPGFTLGAGIAGMLTYVLALSLFAVCVRVTRHKPLSLAYSSDTPEHLVATGPYRVVRHPFYSAYLLSYVAGWLATSNHYLLLVVGIMSIVYVLAARREESKFMQSPLREAFMSYRARTGMFLPHPLRLWRHRGDNA